MQLATSRHSNAYAIQIQNNTANVRHVYITACCTRNIQSERSPVPEGAGTRASPNTNAPNQHNARLEQTPTACTEAQLPGQTSQPGQPPANIPVPMNFSLRHCQPGETLTSQDAFQTAWQLVYYPTQMAPSSLLCKLPQHKTLKFCARF
jgi:hypothetical protein